MRNFAASVEWVRRERIPGVFAVYENPDGELTVHLGARVKSAEAMEHRFDSLFEQPFGWFRRDRLVLNPKGDVSIRMLRDAAGGLRFSGSRFCPDVILLHPYPGLCYSRIRTDGLRAVLHEACLLYTSTVIGIQGKGLAGFQLDLASRKVPQADFRAFGIAQQCNGQVKFIPQLFDQIRFLFMDSVITVREVEPGDIHARQHQLAEDVLRIG